MSEFTITLGGTGQVVKRKRADSQFHGIHPIKSASVRHRLGGAATPSSSHTNNNNRLRGSTNAAATRIPNTDAIRTKDARLGHKDLRLKLLRTRSSGITKTRKPRANPPSSGRELRRNSDTMQVSARDRGRELVYRDPPRTLGTTRSVSPPTPRPYFRAPQHIVRNAALDLHNHRAMQPPPMIAPSVVACRPVPPLPQPNGTYPRSVYLGDASSSVPVLLRSLGLEKYVIQFQAEEIDMPVLEQMSEKDLKDMLIPMGPRKKILQAVMGICRRPPAPAPPLLPQRPL